MTLGCVSAWAGPVEDGIKGLVAHDVENYIEAAKWFRNSAEQGHPFAQFWLGFMYRIGLGVPQDYVAAHMWLNLGKSNRIKFGAGYRDKVAERMTLAQIAEAQRRALDCLNSNYQNCDKAANRSTILIVEFVSAPMGSA